ncbi:MAG: radical SAM protein [Methanomicrobium sp.]|nr:radical SAM protein [Methanomicrobium sp.]
MAKVGVDANFHTIAGKSVVERDDPEYQIYRKKWNEWPENFQAGDFPLHLDLETTNACNLRCPFCATTHNKYNKGFIKEEIWKSVLDEAGENQLYSLKFTYRGEPMLHKDTIRMVEYAKEAGIMDVYFNTNATKLNKENIIGLIDAGLDRISISFEGFTKEVYDKYRIGSDYDLVVSNIENLQKIKQELKKNKPLVRIQTVRVPEILGHEKEYAEFWSKRADEVAFLDMKDEEGNPDHTGIVSDWACAMLWQRMTITWDGKILPCVHDIYEWMNLGVVGGISIKDAWNSVKENEYRRLHKEGKAHEIKACDRCPLRENEISKLKKR